MNIVGAYACSHAGLIVTRRDLAPTGQRDDVFAAYATVRDEIERLRPDAIVIVATDHMQAYPLGNVAAFAIGVGPVAVGVGDAGIDPCKVPVHQPLAQAILAEGVNRGVDFVFSEDVSIDHSFVMPLSLLTPRLDVPIVPVTQNCNVPPRPTFSRSHEVGRVIGEAIRSGPAGRAVVIGTGGLSHWVGDEARRAFMNRPPGTRLPDLAAHPVRLDDTGPINAKFDRGFLQAMERGAARAFIREWPSERVEEEAGNGAHEIRNWLTGAAIVGDAPAQVLSYQSVAEWLTGTAVVRFRTG
jgi:hypothetical protein